MPSSGRRFTCPTILELASLEIVVPMLTPDEIAEAEAAATGPADRLLRGQVVREGPRAVGGLTVVVQTGLGDTLPRIVAAGTTVESGSFSLPFPAGSFENPVSVLVSAAPDSRVELERDTSGRIVDEFVYLILSGDVVGEERTDVARLPDQGELVRSSEFTQDLGGGCVNLTTPNRSLREYRYNAIVRTSDPDVANYTLTKDDDGTYTLAGGMVKQQRQPIDLDNPVRWQDAPEAGDSLSFYQAVTVATGHILWFRSVFKADGYSMGDLVYSLPLAPGQKKQIVSYDVANTLSAAEAQQLTQGESLAAALLDDRTIVDELSGTSMSGSPAGRPPPRQGFRQGSVWAARSVR